MNARRLPSQTGASQPDLDLQCWLVSWAPNQRPNTLHSSRWPLLTSYTHIHLRWAWWKQHSTQRQCCRLFFLDTVWPPWWFWSQNRSWLSLFVYKVQKWTSRPSGSWNRRPHCWLARLIFQNDSQPEWLVVLHCWDCSNPQWSEEPECMRWWINTCHGGVKIGSRYLLLRTNLRRR